MKRTVRGATTLLSATCMLASLHACSAESNEAPAAAPARAPMPPSAASEQFAPEPAPVELREQERAADGVDEPPGAASPEADKKSSAAPVDAFAPEAGDSRARAQVLEVEPIVQGNLDRDIIRRVVRSRIAEVNSCYDAGLHQNAALQGTVTIEFTITAAGKVERASAGDGFEDPKVAKCIADAISLWVFPEPGAGDVTVSYPFELRVGEL